jgi:hypothetical protein
MPQVDASPRATLQWHIWRDIERGQGVVRMREEDAEVVSGLNQIREAHKQAVGASNKMTYLGWSFYR